MRILYLHQYFTVPEVSGGTRSYEFARRLIAKSHDVCMVTSSVGLPKCYQGPSTIRREVVSGISCVIIHVPYANSMSFSKRIVAFFRFALLACWVIVKEKADVVFATSTPLTIAVPALVAKFFRGIPMVFEVRDLWPDVPIAMGALRNPLSRWAARMLERLAYGNASKIVALSPGMAEGIIRNGGLPDKIEVIPNCSDIELFDVPECRGHAMRISLGIPIGVPLVVYAGTFGKVNGVGYLVEIAAVMQTIAPHVWFVLVGDGAEKAKVTERAQSIGLLGKNVLIMDAIPKYRLPDLLSAATVTTSVVIPIRALWDNSANKFFDSFAAGKPIAINHGGWQADILVETGAGLVLSHDNHLLAAQQLASFLNDPQKLKIAGDAARLLAHNRFGRDDMAKRFEEVLCFAAGKTTRAFSQ